MFIQPYQPHELRFAYCYRLYLRCRTYRTRPLSPLAQLDASVLDSLVCPYDIRVLECASDPTDLLVMASLKPFETISGCAGKLKGRTSNWLREALHLEEPTNLLSRGYFACTVGKSNQTVVEQYLEQQGAHHGYKPRLLPPVFVEQYELSPDDEARISAKHAVVVAQFHLVLATWRRKGVFGSHQGRRIAAQWRSLQNDWRIALVKVSFVPDHVHIALRLHPSVAPADVVVQLMNSAQEIIQPDLISAGLERLWQPSGYIGSYGNLASPQIRKYIDNWRRL